jgi:hypothetical protein
MKPLRRGVARSLKDHSKMKSLLAALFLGFAITAGAHAQTIGNLMPGVNYIGNDVGGALVGQVACGSTAIYDASTAGDTQMIAAVAGKATYICGMTIMMPTGAKVQLDSGVNTMATTGNTTSASNQLTSVAATAGIVAGQGVSGTGIPAGTTVSSIAGTTVTMSANATATGSAVAVTFTGGACAFGSKLTPAWTLSFIDASPYFHGLSAPAGSALCINPGTAVPVQAIVHYTQF